VPGRSPLTRGGTAGSAIWRPTARTAKDPTTLVAVVDLSDAELDELVEDAILDAHGEDEQLASFYNLIEDSLVLPFTTGVLGVEVAAKEVSLTDWGITAVCVRGQHRQPIAICDLPLPTPPPAGSEWIAAYQRWAGGR
jgi:hypothetical protein